MGVASASNAEHGLGADPGPAARYATVVADPRTPEIVVQRLQTESLRDIAHGWGIPYKRFLAWIAANGELTDQCKRVRELAGIELRMEGLGIVDDATVDDIAVAKERAAYRERLSRDLNRPLFGKATLHKHEVTFDLGERLRRARERVIDAVAEGTVPDAATLGVVPPATGTPAPAPEAAVKDAVEADLI